MISKKITITVLIFVGILLLGWGINNVQSKDEAEKPAEPAEQIIPTEGAAGVPEGENKLDAERQATNGSCLNFQEDEKCADGYHVKIVNEKLQEDGQTYKEVGVIDTLYCYMKVEEGTLKECRAVSLAEYKSLTGNEPAHKDVHANTFFEGQK